MPLCAGMDYMKPLTSTRKERQAKFTRAQYLEIIHDLYKKTHGDALAEPGLPMALMHYENMLVYDTSDHHDWFTLDLLDEMVVTLHETLLTILV